MAAKDKPSFDDLTKVSPSNDNDNDDVPTKKLAPGEEFVAVIRHIERGVGQYNNTVLHLNDLDGEPFKFWSNRTIDRSLNEADAGPGDTIGVRKDSEPYSYETDDGEQKEAYGFEVGVDN